MECAKIRAQARARAVLAAVSIVASIACGPSPVTAVRIERAIAPTFANLVHVQLSRIGLPPVAVSDLNVIASCRRLTLGSSASGAGDWACTLVWHGPNGRVLRDTYDLSVGTDACYTATLGGGEGQLGGPTIAASDGTNVRNLLYAFDGCFDTR